MPASIGVNLRVTGHCRQGGRKYMEDFFSVAYQQTEDERDLEYAFFGIYDGHGGAEAAAFAKERLMETIVRHKYFWSDNDEDVLRAIKLGYIATHYAMWKEQDKWPKTASGLPSTAGTTASIAFIRRGKIYIGHVGDSAIVLGYQEPGCTAWKAKSLTRDHKPESAVEMSRIEQCGGKVVSKSGVPRVVWNRPRIGHKGPVRRSTPIDEIPFLAVARSLGDLWSYNSELDEFVVSPDPDCSVIPIDTSIFRCLIFGTDGLYNMLNPQMTVHIVQQAERHNEVAALSDAPNKIWLNPSKCLVEKALKIWSTTKMRADNTSVVTLMLDPPGPPRAQVLRNRKKSYPDSGLQIVTRYQNESEEHRDTTETTDASENSPQKSSISPCLSNLIDDDTTKIKVDDTNNSSGTENNKNFVLKARESLSFDPSSTAPELKASDVTVLQNKSESKVSKVEPKHTKNIETKLHSHNLRNSEIKSLDANENVSESKTERCSNCKKANTSAIDEVSTSSYENSSSETSSFNSSEENIQINEISSSSSEPEDEETISGEDENFTKTNLRRGKVRNSSCKPIKKPDKVDNKQGQGRKRLSESNDLIDNKRIRNTNTVNEEVRHNLRIRKVVGNECGMRRNEEMVNKVDSTNKELKKKLSPTKQDRTSNNITSTDRNGVNSNVKNKETVCRRPVTTDNGNTINLRSTDARKSQRVKQNELKLQAKLKIKDKLKNRLICKLNKKKVSKIDTKKVILLKKQPAKESESKSNKVVLNRTRTSARSSIISKSSSAKPECKNKQAVTSKPPTAKVKKSRTFKTGYLVRLRRHISSRTQKK